MKSGTLNKLFGNEKQWHGPCIVVVDAEAAIQSSGTDAIVNAGVKMFAPRLISGRIDADAACYLPDDHAMVVVQKCRIRQATGEDQVQQTVLVIDVDHVAAIEFAHAKSLADLGLTDPPKPALGSAKLRG